MGVWHRPNRAPATIYVGLTGDPFPCLTCKDNLPDLAVDLREREGSLAAADEAGSQRNGAYTRRIRIG